MSADNYLYVRKWRGRYYLEDGCASVEKPPSGKPTGEGYARLEQALYAATLETHNGYYEYGMSVSPAVAKEIATAQTERPHV